jgi:hypothetical protein
MRNHHPDARRAREQAYEERAAIPELFMHAAAVHESGHIAVAAAIGQVVQSAKLTPNGGVTRIQRDGTTFDVIGAMIVCAAGRAAQRKYGATHSYYSRWSEDDDRELARLAVSLVEAKPNRADRKQAALKLIRGAEEAAAQMIENLWDNLEGIADELLRGEELDADDVERLTRNIARINFRGARAGEGSVDGTPFFWRTDGHMGGRAA